MDLRLNRAYERQKVTNMRKRRDRRKKIDPIAQPLVQKMRDFKEAGHEEILSDMDTSSLADYLILLREQMTDEQLDIHWLTENVTKAMTMIDVYDALSKRQDNQQLAPEKMAQLEAANAYMAYFKFHLSTVLGDYGIDLENPVYTKNQVDRIDYASQASRWAQDYNNYQKLRGNALPEEPDAQTINENRSNYRLQRLEQQAGVTQVQPLIERRGNLYVKELTSDTSNFDSTYQAEPGTTSILRYKKEILMDQDTAKRTAAIGERLMVSYLSLENRLKQAGGEHPDFFKLKSLLSDYIKDLNTGYEKSSTNYDLNQKHHYIQIRDTVQKILTNSSDFTEKQYASLLMNYFQEEFNGNLELEQNGQTYIGDEERLTLSAKRLAEQKVKRQARDSKKPVVVRSIMQDMEKIPLFLHEPSLKDLHQGALGDCYMISVLGSLVSKDPQLIKDMMRDNQDGTVTVRFYKSEAMGLRIITWPIYVTIRKSIPMFVTNLGFAVPRDTFSRGAFWVKMIEKAYAVARPMLQSTKYASNDYRSIEGGNFDETMNHFTGEKGMNFSISENATGTSLEKRFLAKSGDIPEDFKVNSADRMLFYLKHKNESQKNALSNRSDAKKAYPLKNYKNELKTYSTGYALTMNILSNQLNSEGIQSKNLDSEATSYYLEMAKGLILKLLTVLNAFSRDNPPKSKADLLDRGTPKDFAQSLYDYAAACNFDTAMMADTASFISQAITDKLRSFRTTVTNNNNNTFTEYNAAENELFNKVSTAIEQGKYVGMATKEFKDSKDASGNAGERMKAGMPGNHAYTILGTEVYQINGEEKKFFRVFNPHAGNIPQYKLEEGKTLRRIAVKRGTSYEFATNGIFLLELRDMMGVSNQYYTVEGEKHNEL